MLALLLCYWVLHAVVAIQQRKALVYVHGGRKDDKVGILTLSRVAPQMMS